MKISKLRSMGFYTRLPSVQSPTRPKNCLKSYPETPPHNDYERRVEQSSLYRGSNAMEEGEVLDVLVSIQMEVPISERSVLLTI